MIAEHRSGGTSTRSGWGCPCWTTPAATGGRLRGRLLPVVGIDRTRRPTRILRPLAQLRFPIGHPAFPTRNLSFQGRNDRLDLRSQHLPQLGGESCADPRILPISPLSERPLSTDRQVGVGMVTIRTLSRLVSRCGLERGLGKFCRPTTPWGLGSRDAATTKKKGRRPRERTAACGPSSRQSVSRARAGYN